MAIIRTIKNQRTIKFLIEYIALIVEVRIILDSLKIGVYKIKTKILKYLNDRKIFSTEVVAETKVLALVAIAAS